jgi:hypothetical protein
VAVATRGSLLLPTLQMNINTEIFRIAENDILSTFFFREGERETEIKREKERERKRERKRER